MDPESGHPGLRQLAGENRGFVLGAARWAGAMLGITRAIAAFLPPEAAASALRSSSPSTGTTPVTSAPSTSAISVLNTRSGETPSAPAASRP